MIKATVIFGKEAVNRYDQTGKVPTKQWLSKKSGVVDTKKFKTRAEYDAYSQGLNDADGWEQTFVFPPIGEQLDCTYCEQWRLYFLDRDGETYCPDCGNQLKQQPEISYGTVTFQNRIYPTRTIDIPGYMDDAVISVEELNGFIRDSRGKYISSEAEQLEAIDNGIFFYVPKDQLGLPCKELANLVINYLGE